MKAPADRGKTRGLRVSDRSWTLWQRAAESLGLKFAEYLKITMDFASMRHLGMDDEIAGELHILESEEGDEGARV